MDINRKDSILVAATNVFAEKGFEASSVDDIAVAANTAKGTIYYHYSSKEEILFELINKGILDFVRIAKQSTENVDNPRKKLEILIEAQLDYFCRYQNFCRVFLSEIWRIESYWKKSVKAIQDNYLTIINEIIKEGQRSGDFRLNLSERVLTFIFFNLIAVASLEWVVFHSDIPREEMLQTINLLLSEGIIEN